MNQKKYNLLYIFTDQQRFDTLASYGNDKIKVPNLNKLAEDCAVFEKAYVTQPVCTPSRGTLMTGLYPHNHGCIENNDRLKEDIPTLAELIKDENYSCGYIGKWHLGNEVVKQHGFDHWVSIEDVYREHYAKEEYREIYSDYHHFLVENGFLPDVIKEDEQIFSRFFGTRLPEAFSRPAFIAQKSKAFIRENKDKPFVLYAAFLEPHPPYNSAYDNYYDPEEVLLAPAFHEMLGDNVPLRYQFNIRYQKEVGRQYPLKDEKTWRKLTAQYWGAISLVDKYVGEILECLKENNLWDNTIIVFTSDHGEMMGDYKMLQKMVMLESSVRVPMMIKIPKLTEGGKRIEIPVSQVDLLPTLLDAMDIQAKGKLDGESLMPMITAESEAVGRDVFIEWTGEEGEHRWFTVNKDQELAARITEVYGASVRAVVSTDNWKLCLQTAGEHELYDLNTDPLETKNLYGSYQYQEKFEELQAKILEWQKTSNDTLKLNPNHSEKEITHENQL